MKAKPTFCAVEPIFTEILNEYCDFGLRIKETMQ